MHHWPFKVRKVHESAAESSYRGVGTKLVARRIVQIRRLRFVHYDAVADGSQFRAARVFLLS